MQEVSRRLADLRLGRWGWKGDRGLGRQASRYWEAQRARGGVGRAQRMHRVEAIAERGSSPGPRGDSVWGSGRGHPLTYAQLNGVGVVGPAQQQADEHHRDPVEHPPAPPPHAARARGRHLPAADTCPAPPPPPPAGLARGRARGSRSTRRDRPGGGGWLCCGHRGRRGASSPSRGGEWAPRTPAAPPG